MDAWARERWNSPEYLFWLSGAVRTYLAMLLLEEIPLTAALTVACVLADFCQIAGLPVPVEVEQALSLPQRHELANRVIVESGQ